jgi:integrase
MPCFSPAARTNREPPTVPRDRARLGLGLRKGELLALRWDDVDLERGVLRVRRNVQRLPEMGLEPTARIRLPKPLRLDRPASTPALSSPQRSARRSSRNLNRLFDELITKAGVRRIRFHDLRHTCASLLLAQNVPARVVMEILGHSQLAMTTDLYSHVMPTALRAAADAMDRVLVQPN